MDTRLSYTTHELFGLWQRTAAQYASDLALVEVPGGRRWTFAELDHAVDLATAPPPHVFPRGSGASFVISVLRAWRDGSLTCPLEAYQAQPHFGALPAWAAHAKLTSGTGGAAKCVLFREKQLIADASNIVATMGLRREWPNIGVISMAHSYGFSNLILPLILHAIPLVLLDAPLPELVKRAAAPFSGVTIAAVPALWRTWLGAGAIPANTKVAISAGAPLPLELECDVYQRHQLKIHNFYGSSECGGIAYDASETPRADAKFAGTALQGVSLDLSPESALIVTSAAVGETYWPHPETELGDGQFVTADLATLQGSNVWLNGRLRDVINVSGRKVAPETIEAALREHPSVQECVIFSIADSARHQVIVACVNSPNRNVAELSEYLSGRLPAWQIPRRWWFRNDLSPDGRGKLSRVQWREEYLRRHPGD